MRIDIPAESLLFVHRAIASGRFESERAMLGAALQLLQEQEDLRQAVQNGFDQIERGECIEFDEEGLDEYFEGLVQRAERRAAVKGNSG